MDEEKMKQLLKYLSSLNQANQLAMASKLVSQAASSLTVTQPKSKTSAATSELTEQEKKDRNLAAVTKCKQYKIENIQRLESEVIDLDKRKTEAQCLNEYLKQQIREQLERRLRTIQVASSEDNEVNKDDEEKQEEK